MEYIHHSELKGIIYLKDILNNQCGIIITINNKMEKLDKITCKLLYLQLIDIDVHTPWKVCLA